MRNRKQRTQTRQENQIDFTQIVLIPVESRQIWKKLFCWEKSDNSGIGVVEVILILVVLIALVIIFRDQLTGLVEKLLKNVTKDALKV